MDTTTETLVLEDEVSLTTDPRADRFLGVSKHKAHDMAEQLNLVFRLVSVNGEVFLGYPTDGVRSDRVCAELVNGVITKAVIQ